MAGGTLLLWWGYEYHPTNSQLWMVPLGLILLVTPVIAWVAAVVSTTCNCKVEDDGSKTNELVVQAGDSVSVADAGVQKASIYMYNTQMKDSYAFPDHGRGGSCSMRYQLV
ncbi:hypothetical protein H0E87_005108 [Populus deltoides]|uniref:Uncharacterized protein n=1 Tax=Populus deltoides TaxID=3696 RepID=A0A8T2ZHG9_POPDE|nr:hypothetical protein H0E87_005108 [Populus deltoides]